MAKLSSLIDKHRKFYDKNEKPAFDKARRYYRGDFWTVGPAQGQFDSTVANSLLCSKNLIYAIADTALSALLGPNPQVAANPRNRLSQEFAPAATGLLEYVFKHNNMRRRAATTLIDAVLCKRGIFKTGWNKTEDSPIIRAVDPSSLFFDLAVRDVDDIRYWLEATVVPWSEFKARVDSGRYAGTKISDVNPDRYPRWLLDQNQRGDTKSVRDSTRWVTVWEYYNRETNKVQHYVQQADTVVFEDEIDYIPYSMYNLNQSGVDCLGLSEVQLVLNQQETVNDLLTHWKKIVYLMVPRILYDAGRITEEDLNKAVESSVGSFVGITPQNSEALRTLATLFYEMPLPDTQSKSLSHGKKMMPRSSAHSLKPLEAKSQEPEPQRRWQSSMLKCKPDSPLERVMSTQPSKMLPAKPSISARSICAKRRWYGSQATGSGSVLTLTPFET